VRRTGQFTTEEHSAKKKITEIREKQLDKLRFLGRIQIIEGQMREPPLVARPICEQ